METGANTLECGDDRSHHAFFGTHSPTDILLMEGHREEEYKLLRSAEADISYQVKPDFDGVISYIEVVDNYKDGNGGCASLTSGGVGSRDVNIHMKAKPNHGFSFEFKIYGQGTRKE